MPEPMTFPPMTPRTIGTAMHEHAEALSAPAADPLVLTHKTSTMLTIIANPAVDGHGNHDLIKLRPGKHDRDMILVIDKPRGYAQIVVTEPNVEALYAALGKWLGK